MIWGIFKDFLFKDFEFAYALCGDFYDLGDFKFSEINFFILDLRGFIEFLDWGVGVKNF